ncbi:hypothetical protein Q3G72_008271 [Acer saccharum]|nr:hypothetical protein Q3G72_008271 [Acer saccharum]
MSGSGSTEHKAEDYVVKYYVFGFSADRRYWNNEDRYAFIKDQLKALEADGQLVTTFFTFVNEANSTKIAKDFLKSRFPELFCLDRFKRMYPDIPKIALYKQNPRKLKIDFAAFRKRVIDAYAAAHFTKAFLNMGYRQKLNPKKSQGKAKFEKMKKFAISCGYKVDGGQEC